MSKLFALLAVSAASPVFANTMAGSKFFISTTQENEDLTQAEYEALDWIQVKGIGSHGETGNTQNVVSYDTWDLLFTQKAKGIANAGDPELEFARISNDPGQIALDAAARAGNPNRYAFKIERNDAPEGGSPTVFYNRGVVTGPRTQHGRNEDFDLKLYTCGLEQEQIEVPSSALSLAGIPPAGTENAAYSFTPTIDGETGAVTYSWFGANLATYGLAINAATGALTSADLLATGTVIGTIVAVDSTNARAVLRVKIVIS